jgi:hypothetical protein
MSWAFCNWRLFSIYLFFSWYRQKNHLILQLKGNNTFHLIETFDTEEEWWVNLIFLCLIVQECSSFGSGKRLVCLKPDCTLNSKIYNTYIWHPSLSVCHSFKKKSEIFSSETTVPNVLTICWIEVWFETYQSLTRAKFLLLNIYRNSSISISQHFS